MTNSKKIREEVKVYRSNGLIDIVRNKFEKAMLKEMLAHEKPAKVKKIEYEADKLRYVLEKWYIPDFVITRKDGSKIYIETKGYFRPDDRAKLLATRDANPGTDIRIIFMSDQKLNKNAKMKYSGWAEKHNFTYSIGHVPFDWFKV